jgi:hypothetical protein
MIIKSVIKYFQKIEKIFTVLNQKLLFMEDIMLLVI